MPRRGDPPQEGYTCACGAQAEYWAARRWTDQTMFVGYSLKSGQYDCAEERVSTTLVALCRYHATEWPKRGEEFAVILRMVEPRLPARPQSPALLPRDDMTTEALLARALAGTCDEADVKALRERLFPDDQAQTVKAYLWLANGNHACRWIAPDLRQQLARALTEDLA